MTSNRITINGQQYDNPESMPPDVRRIYEQAMRMAGTSLAGAQSDGKTSVFTSHVGHIGASAVVNQIITVNNRTYGSIDELPPDVRQFYDDALKVAGPQATHPKISMNVSVNLTGPKGRTLGDPSSPSMPPLPIEPSSNESLRRLPISLAIAIFVALIFWALWGR